MPTLKDVAREAGVAPITVSRVINNQDAVKEKTREKVLKVMAELQYIPNVAARNLITKRSHIIDVYIPEDLKLDNPFMLQLIAGVSEELSEKMYSFLILRNRKKEHICDGYIVMGLLKDEITSKAPFGKRRIQRNFLRDRYHSNWSGKCDSGGRASYPGGYFCNGV